MKKIDNCENSTVLVALLLPGITLVMGGYRPVSRRGRPGRAGPPARGGGAGGPVLGGPGRPPGGRRLQPGGRGALHR